MPDTPTLTDEQRAEVERLMREHARGHAVSNSPYGHVCTIECGANALAPLIARMVADARAEVSAAVEAALSTLADASASGYYIVHKNTDGSERGRSLDAYVVRPLRAALTDPAAAVTRIKAEARDEALLEAAAMPDRRASGGTAYSAAAREVRALRACADRIGGESDG